MMLVSISVPGGAGRWPERARARCLRCACQRVPARWRGRFRAAAYCGDPRRGSWLRHRVAETTHVALECELGLARGAEVHRAIRPARQIHPDDGWLTGCFRL